jgi:hypothetical protein
MANQATLTKDDLKKSDTKEEELLVYDSSTRAPEYDADGKIKAGTGFRIHEQPLNGKIKQYRFAHGEPLRLVRSEAMKFARHASFTVTDEEGNRIEPKIEVPATNKPFVLAEDQVVARLSELSGVALLARVHMEPGGERFDKTSAREKQIGFLVNIRKQRDAASKPRDAKNADEFTPAPSDASEEVDIGA